VSSGIAAGDLESGGMAATGRSASAAPRADDVDAGLFGGSTTGAGTRSSERQRELESARESRGAGTSAVPSSGVSGAQPGTRVAGRGRPTAGLSAWLADAENPVVMMRRMQDDLDRVFRVFGLPRFAPALAPARELEELFARSPTLAQTAQWSPQIEVFEREGNLVVLADLPAVRKEDVEVNVDNDVLTIRGHRRQEQRDTEGGYRRTERSYGSFFRQIPLPEGVDPNAVEASYRDGVLEVVVPSPREQTRGRRRVDIR
jgi:HSP20 family protein